MLVTEQGFDPTTDELAWSDLELVTEVGPFEPGGGLFDLNALFERFSSVLTMLMDLFGF